MFRHQMCHPLGAFFITLPNYISTIAALLQLYLCTVRVLQLWGVSEEIQVVSSRNLGITDGKPLRRWTFAVTLMETPLKHTQRF
jgi:hypothetical protein